jgi:hypothetical protein
MDQIRENGMALPLTIHTHEFYMVDNGYDHEGNMYQDLVFTNAWTNPSIIRDHSPRTCGQTNPLQPSPIRICGKMRLYHLYDPFSGNPSDHNPANIPPLVQYPEHTRIAYYDPKDFPAEPDDDPADGCLDTQIMGINIQDLNIPTGRHERSPLDRASLYQLNAYRALLQKSYQDVQHGLVKTESQNARDVIEGIQYINEGLEPTPKPLDAVMPISNVNDDPTPPQLPPPTSQQPSAPYVLAYVTEPIEFPSEPKIHSGARYFSSRDFEEFTIDPLKVKKPPSHGSDGDESESIGSQDSPRSSDTDDSMPPLETVSSSSSSSGMDTQSSAEDITNRVLHFYRQVRHSKEATERDRAIADQAEANLLYQKANGFANTVVIAVEDVDPLPIATLAPDPIVTCTLHTTAYKCNTCGELGCCCLCDEYIDSDEYHSAVDELSESLEFVNAEIEQRGTATTPDVNLVACPYHKLLVPVHSCDDCKSLSCCCSCIEDKAQKQSHEAINDFTGINEVPIQSQQSKLTPAEVLVEARKRLRRTQSPSKKVTRRIKSLPDPPISTLPDNDIGDLNPHRRNRFDREDDIETSAGESNMKSQPKIASIGSILSNPIDAYDLDKLWEDRDKAYAELAVAHSKAYEASWSPSHPPKNLHPANLWKERDLAYQKYSERHEKAVEATTVRFQHLTLNSPIPPRSDLSDEPTFETVNAVIDALNVLEAANATINPRLLEPSTTPDSASDATRIAEDDGWNIVLPDTPVPSATSSMTNLATCLCSELSGGQKCYNCRNVELWKQLNPEAPYTPSTDFTVRAPNPIVVSYGLMDHNLHIIYESAVIETLPTNLPLLIPITRLHLRFRGRDDYYIRGHHHKDSFACLTVHPTFASNWKQRLEEMLHHRFNYAASARIDRQMSLTERRAAESPMVTLYYEEWNSYSSIRQLVEIQAAKTILGDWLFISYNPYLTIQEKVKLVGQYLALRQSDRTSSQEMADSVSIKLRTPSYDTRIIQGLVRADLLNSHMQQFEALRWIEEFKYGPLREAFRDDPSFKMAPPKPLAKVCQHCWQLSSYHNPALCSCNLTDACTIEGCTQHGDPDPVAQVPQPTDPCDRCDSSYFHLRKDCFWFPEEISTESSDEINTADDKLTTAYPTPPPEPWHTVEHSSFTLEEVF